MRAEVANSYPHMLAGDTRIWSAFLDDPPIAITDVEYDVRVGAVPFDISELTEQEQKIARGLWRKRIDVIAETAHEVYVIEVKPVASVMALGQVIVYMELVAEEFESDKDVVGAIVAGEADPDIVRLAELYGIEVFAERVGYFLPVEGL